MDFRDLLRLLLWSLWGLALALLVSAGLWGTLTAAGDATGGRAAQWLTAIVAILIGVDLTAIVVALARREIN